MAYDQTCPECGEKNWMPEGQYAMLEVSGGKSLQLNADSMRTSAFAVDANACLNCRFVKPFSEAA